MKTCHFKYLSTEHAPAAALLAALLWKTKLPVLETRLGLSIDMFNMLAGEGSRRGMRMVVYPSLASRMPPHAMEMREE